MLSILVRLDILMRETKRGHLNVPIDFGQSQLPPFLQRNQLPAVIKMPGHARHRNGEASLLLVVSAVERTGVRPTSPPATHSDVAAMGPLFFPPSRVGSHASARCRR
jgi:hypothetical protein